MSKVFSLAQRWMVVLALDSLSSVEKLFRRCGVGNGLAVRISKYLKVSDVKWQT